MDSKRAAPSGMTPWPPEQATVPRAAAVMKPPRIDPDSYWLQPVPEGMRATLLPDHPWIDRERLPGGIEEGATWLVCADLVAEPDLHDRPILSPLAPRSVLHFRGRPLGREDVSKLTGWCKPLVLLPSGSALRVITIGSWSGRMFPGVAGQSISFALTDGTKVVHTIASELEGYNDGIWRSSLSWWALACAAAIVPDDHPFATDRVACAAVITRIERAAQNAGTGTTKSDADH